MENKDENATNSMPKSVGREQTKGQPTTPDKREDPARKKQKESGQLPLHDEAIGGA